jgi:parallel beta-helix repeat protein
VIESNIIARNIAGHFGGGITAWETSSPHILSNTIVSNTAVMGGGGIYLTRRCSSKIRRNIVANNLQGGGITRDDEVTSPTLSCNDVWSNIPANYAGLPDVTGTDGNISIDPLFCNLLLLDLRLDEISPCTADNSPTGCGLIGALDVGCGVTPVTAGTWGQVKTHFIQGP